MGFGALDATGVSPGMGGGSPEIPGRRPRDAHGCGYGLGLGFEPFFFSTSIYLVLTDEGSDNFGVGENIFFSNFLHFFSRMSAIRGLYGKKLYEATYLLPTQ